MPDAIENALTREEWAARRKASYADGGEGVAVYLREDGYVMVDDGDAAGVHLPANRHALAALALHDQPFGFTPEDLGSLREVLGYAYEAFCGLRSATEADPDWQRVQSLAARIAALLPPAP